MAAVAAAVADHGPIGFDEYMNLALYGPGGFFRDPPVGADRHFVTGPHVHPFVFGHCLRDALLDTWQALGEPDPFPILELGAGDGTLAASLLDAFGELPAPAAAYAAVEISPGARSSLAALGLTAFDRIEPVEPFEGVAFANEVLDNLPFAWVRADGRGVVAEVRVGIDGERLVEVLVPWSRPEPVPALEPGTESTVPVGALAMLDALVARLRRGVVILIDYGTPDGPSGGPRGIRSHREVADVLSDPGGSDITAGVDLAAFAEHATAGGLQAFEPVRQSDALTALGLDRWDHAMRDRQASLQLENRGAEAVRVWESRSRASLLKEPAGMGGFWWLVLATPDLPRPRWLERAE
jgi:SAM-dependent MidA family methyltransferase